MYVAVKGGTAAIENSWRLLAAQRRGDATLPELSVAQIRSQLSLAVDRVMTEGSLYDPELAALAIKQASGDLIEAIFLLRAYRTTLPRFGYSQPLDTAQMLLTRRVSATFKEVPGGQVLGATYDYTQRLLDFALLAEGGSDAQQPISPAAGQTLPPSMPRINELMQREGLIETPQALADSEPGDLTREPLMFPADRPLRLQALARGDEGWLLALGYSTQRGYASAHPFAGEIRRGAVSVNVVADELGFEIDIGEVEVTECQMINQFAGNREVAPQFTQGYGLAFGGAERKSMAMALVDRALR
ncbi:MAG: carbon-phosphorus lyase complex subunit PhnI, partial [Polaromonas sp.]|nr:carbon-phosphorus lyase complex subunit PhnI [Polaromonas sp.]